MKKRSKKKHIFLVAAGLIILLFSGCQGKTEEAAAQLFAMDTIMEFTVYGKNAEEIISGVKKRVHELEKSFSVTIPESDISKINTASGAAVAVSEDTMKVVKQSLELSKETEGRFDITIFPIVKAWGFTTDQYRVVKKSERERLCQLVDYRKVKCEGERIQISNGMEIDLGGIAKGYVSQVLINYIKEMGADSAILSLGGNIHTFGYKPDGNAYTIGIKDPLHTDQLLGTLNLTDRAVVTSGSYERNFTTDGKTYHHIMDQATGAPAESDLLSVTVVAEDAAKADALSTALFVMKSREAKQYAANHPEIGIVLVYANGDIYVSDNCVDKFTNKR